MELRALISYQRLVRIGQLGIILTVLTGLGALPAAAEPLAVRVSGVDAPAATALEDAGFDVAFRGPSYVEILAEPHELAELSRRGYAWEPLERDLFPGARTGSREGHLDPEYHTYDEMLAELQMLAATYPDICMLYDVGDAESKHYTWTNYDKEYDLWAVRISDQPDRDEPEPCIVYDARHHAREPVTTEIVLAVARHLCENYGIDPDITDLIDSSEIWCVTMVNPDGHQWVEDVDVWWRKTLWDYNENHVVNSSEGIDPNRNYDWHWNGGYWSDETYGGPYAWSAIEVASMRDLHNQQRPAINPTYHSYGEVVLYPFGYGVNPEPAVTEIATQFAGLVGYATQQSTTAYGSSKDWVYGSIGGVSFTVETATTFIPSGAQMEQIVAEVLPGSIWLAERLWGPSIHGTVTDSIAGIPLEATIHIPEIHDVYGNGELWDIVTEASTGYFCRMRPAASQMITLEVSAEGYHDKTVIVTTGGSEATVVAIELVPVSFERGILAGTVSNVTAGGTPVPDASVTVRMGPAFETDLDGHYVGYVDPGTYTVVVTHPSFAPDSSEGVGIVVGETTTLDFSLVDIAGPEISGTTEYANTDDTVGPYEIETTIHEMSALVVAQLRYRVAGGPFQDVDLVPMSGNDYRAEIPGQPYTTFVEYYVYAEDEGGNSSTDPAGAPSALYGFFVAPRLTAFADDLEGGAPGWSHYVASGGFSDQWHLSTQRNHTPSGATSWKCGDTGAGDYADLLDAALETPAFDLGPDGRLVFWHWIDAEDSGTYPEQAYDGGILEVSLSGGNWEQVTPEGGYSHTCREGSVPGPFPAGTPMFSGTHDWEQVTVDLGDYQGSLRLRFRFGSDGATAGEGWYVDDVEVSALALPSDVADDEAAGAPLATRVSLSCSPSPLTAGSIARIVYRLPHSARVDLHVVDATGRLVRRLVATRAATGGVFVWDGTDGYGRQAATGLYWLRLVDGEAQLATQKVVVLH